MAVREREEKGDSSNTKIEEEEDTNLQIGSSNSQNQIEKPPINEESKENNGEESERLTKRARITESESSTNKEEDDESEWGKDPLDSTWEIVSKYHDFIDYLYQNLKYDEQKEDLKLQWQKWKEILERGKMLVEAVNRSLRTVSIEMEYIKAEETFEKQYIFRKTHIPNLLGLVRDINSRIESSNNFRLVSDIKNRGRVLEMCLKELERSKQELSEMLGVIKVLKELDLHLDDDDDDDEEEEEDEDDEEKE